MAKKNKKSKIIELGCGIGFTSAILSKIGHEVISTDCSLDTLEVANINIQSIAGHSCIEYLK